MSTLTNVIRHCEACQALLSTPNATRFIKDGFAIQRCQSCRLMFRGQLPHSTELVTIYGDKYFMSSGDDDRQGYLDYTADGEFHRRTARRRLQALRKLSHAGDLLDVGCAAGFFVDEASKAGWTARGVDISAIMTQWAKEHLAIQVERGTLADVPLASQSQDVITMWDYIEHSITPRQDVSRAFHLLRAGGLLVLSTGDATSLLARLSGARWHLMTPAHHNFFFSRRSIRTLLTQVGFIDVEIAYPAAIYPVRYLAHKACLIVRTPIVDTLARRIASARIGQAGVPMNLWDVMTVTAVRPAST